MNVSFTGFRNAGASDVLIGDIGSDKKALCSCFNVELTNDGDKDLDSFREVLHMYPNAADSNFITVQSAIYAEGEFDIPQVEIALNNKKLELNRQNLWVYSMLVKFLEKVSKCPKKDYKVSEGYLESLKCRAMFSSPIAVEDVVGDDSEKLRQYLRMIHEPEVVSDKAFDMAQTLDETVRTYLA